MGLVQNDRCEEVSLSSAAANASKSVRYGKASLTGKAQPNRLPGVLAVGRVAVTLPARGSAGSSREFERATGSCDQGLARKAEYVSLRPAHRSGSRAAIGRKPDGPRRCASGKKFAPIWSRFRRGRSFTVRRTCVCRLDCAGCADLIAVLRRFGHAYRIGRQALGCTCSPAGRFRARWHGSVARPALTSPATRAEARQRRPSPLVLHGPNLAALSDPS